MKLLQIKFEILSEVDANPRFLLRQSRRWCLGVLFCLDETEFMFQSFLIVLIDREKSVEGHQADQLALTKMWFQLSYWPT